MQGMKFYWPRHKYAVQPSSRCHPCRNVVGTCRDQACHKHNLSKSVPSHGSQGLLITECPHGHPISPDRGGTSKDSQHRHNSLKKVIRKMIWNGVQRVCSAFHAALRTKLTKWFQITNWGSSTSTHAQQSHVPQSPGWHSRSQKCSWDCQALLH